MVMNLPGVAVETAFAVGIIFCFQRFQIRLQRGLGINDDVAAVRQFDDHVRPQAATVGSFLFDKIAVVEHPGHFDHFAQLDLPPAATDRRGAQRTHQVSGFRFQFDLAVQ